MNKGESVTWEWHVLSVDEDGDCVDVDVYETLAEAIDHYDEIIGHSDGYTAEIEIVRDLIDEDGFVADREFLQLTQAYMSGLKHLPGRMSGGSPVPSAIRKAVVELSN